MNKSGWLGFVSCRFVLLSMLLSAVFLLTGVFFDYVKIEPRWNYLRFKEAGFVVEDLKSDDGLLFMTHMDSLSRALIKQDDVASLSASVEDLGVLVARFPYSGLMLRYAKSQSLAGDSKKADEVMLRLCKMHSVRICDDSRRRWSGWLSALSDR